MKQPEFHGEETDELTALRKRREEAASEYRPVREEQRKNDGGSYAQPKWIVVFPTMPEALDEILRWLAGVLMLCHTYPIGRVERTGERGPEGVVTLHREGAGEIIFHPCKLLSSPAGLISTLNAYMESDDLTPFAYTDQNCAEIWRAIRLVESYERVRSAADRGHEIITAYLHEATQVTGHTIEGTGVERYRAVDVLRRAGATGDDMPPVCLLDSVSGKTVLRATDIAPFERPLFGVVRHGVLDSILSAAGWQKRDIRGWERPGKQDRGRPAHAVVWVGDGE